MADLAFDTGHTKPLDTLVAEGFMTLISPLVYDDGDEENTRGPYLKTLGQAPAGVDAILEMDGCPMQELCGPLPAAMVVIHKAASEDIGDNLLRWNYEVHVDVVTGYPGQWILGRLDPDQDGDARQDPGIRASVQHIVEQLHNRSLPGLDNESGAIKISQRRLVAAVPEWTAWRITATVTIEHYIAESDERDAEELASIEVSHNVDDGGIVTRQRRNS